MGVQLNLSPSYDSAEESVTPKVIPKPSNNPTNQVTYVPADPYSDSNSLDFSSSDSSNSSYDEYYKQIRCAKKYKKKHQSRMRFGDPIKKCAKLTSKLLTATHKSKVVKFKLDKDTLQQQFYFLSFMNSLKILLSTFS